MASIRITSMGSFKDATGTLVLVHPNDTPRPVNYWSVPRWWGTRERTIYEHCARIDDTANNKSIYISSSTGFPHLLIEESGGNYTFDSDKTREHINRIFVTSDPLLQVGDDYSCPLRRGDITKIGTVVTIGTVAINGPLTATVGETSSYTATISGNAGNLSYSWAITDAEIPGLLPGQGTATATPTWVSANDQAIIMCVVSSADPDLTTEPDVETGIKVKVTTTSLAAKSIGTPTIVGDGNANAGDTGVEYHCSVIGGGAPVSTYTWTATNGAVIAGGQGTDTVLIDFPNGGGTSVQVSIDSTYGNLTGTHPKTASRFVSVT